MCVCVCVYLRACVHLRAHVCVPACVSVCEHPAVCACVSSHCLMQALHTIQSHKTINPSQF